jgi:hypothetical protein
MPLFTLCIIIDIQCLISAFSIQTDEVQCCVLMSPVWESAIYCSGGTLLDGVSQSVSQPISQSFSLSVSQSTRLSISHSVIQPVRQSVIQPISQSISPSDS